MAPSPFRRKKAARNLALAEAALALAKDRTGRSRSRRPSAKLLLIGGAVAAAGAAALLKRDKVAKLLPSHTETPSYTPPAPPQQSNYDAPGPVANTATPVPAPDPHEAPPAAIDEAHEEAAAAAEAGAIGGSPSGYAGPEEARSADEGFRPLAEAGEGESEGEEQADAELADNATYRDAGTSDAERQIDDAIEAAPQPFEGEEPQGTQSSFLPPEPAGAPAGDEPAVSETPGTPPTGTSEPEEAGPAEPAAETPGTPPTQAPDEAEESGDDWRTWSGRAVDP